MAADRRDPGGRGEDFDWLYGDPPGSAGSPGDDATQAVSSSAPPPAPDATRKMPVPHPPPGPAGPPGSPPPQRSAPPLPPPPTQQPYAGGPPPYSPGQPHQAPAPPPPGRRAKAPKPPRRRRGFRLRWLLLLPLLWLVYLIAVPFWAWTSVTEKDVMPTDGRPAEQDGTTYLIVGSDSRGDLSSTEKQEYGTGDASGQRTDTIMLLHTGSGPNLLMSIPRDSIVEIPGHGSTKINAAFAYGGPKLLIQTIEQDTGIRVDNYVEIGFGGFVDMVDAVGGVTICPTQDMKDPLANLDVKKGCQEADGTTALGYARSRHTSNLGDLDRAKHQREVVSAVGDKILSPWTFINPVRYYRVNVAGASSLTVSDGTGPIDMAKFAWAMTRVNGTDGLTCGVPIADMAVNWDADRSKQMFDYIINDKTADIPDSLCTQSGLPG